MTIEIHPLSDVKSQNIGAGTHIWQYCVVFEGAKIGENCNICAQVLIENDVVIGDNVTVKSGVQLWDGVRIENNVFIGPNVTFTNDLYPRSKTPCETKCLGATIKNGASIGANATILPGITIAEGALIGAGSVVTRNVPPNAIVQGNPARIVGYANATPVSIANTQLFDDRKPPYSEATNVRGVTIHKFPLIKDIRGNLTVGEFEQHIPFVPKRYFMVFDVKSKETRGEHAHHACHQFLICVRGSCSVLADDGENRTEVLLDSLDKGLNLPPMIWGVQYKFTQDAILLVFASDHYNAADYIRNYSEFIQTIKT